MAFTFKVNGVAKDPDAVFKARGGSTARGDIGVHKGTPESSQNWSDRYYASTGGDTVSGTSNINVRLSDGAPYVDVLTLFRDINYVQPPSIVSQSGGGDVNVGDTASFSVTASGDAPLSYQWKKDGSNIGGATSSTYSFVTTSTSDSGGYACTVTNSAGSATSSALILSVSEPGVAPTITLTSGGGTINAGDTASFGVAADGTAPLYYQWRKNGSNISGATSATYSFTASESDSGTYTVRVYNSYGEDISDGIALTVNPAGTAPIVTVSGGGAITVGQTASFSASATGSTPISYSWSGPHGTGSGTTYSFTATSTSDSGTYTCTATNSYGSDSDSASLTVNPAGNPATITGTSYTQMGTPGTNCPMSVTASGDTPLSYQWYSNGTLISGATSSSYTGTYPSTSRSYSCTVTNAYGSDSATFTIYGL
jgi:hypothetical protein